MNANLVTGPSPSFTSRILIADYDSSSLETLVHTLEKRLPKVRSDVCVSCDNAMEKLIASPYNLIISDVHLAEMHYFSLLKHNEVLQKSVPVVITAAASDTQAARQALEYGAFDLITRPVHPIQAIATIRLALWQNQLMAIIARKEKAIERYRQHFAAYPADKKMKETFRKSLLLVQRTLSSYPKTIQQIEETLMCFNHLAGRVGKEAREQALKRLHPLVK
jgi:DNA-binding NtrC family response regulator